MAGFWMAKSRMLLYLLLSVIGSTYSICDHHARTNMVPDRSTIVHLFEWKWTDIADECERFLAPKGYGGVQISPPSENLILHLTDGTRPWYERYQPISYILKTRSGDEREFLDMTTRCNRVGVRIYADVVINHMTANNRYNIGTAGSTADLQNYSYPAVPYGKEHFHIPGCGVHDYNNADQVRNCELVGLKDLNHNLAYVREKITEYLNHLIDLGVAGFRVDAAKHMWPDNLKDIYNELNCLNTNFGFCPFVKPYIYQEVIYHRDGAIKPHEYTKLGDVTEFRVGTELKTVFRGKNPLKWLVSWGEQWDLSPSDTALVFIDNHDTQRQSDVLTYKEAKAYKGATAFMLAHPYGEPRVMSSYFFKNGDQGPPAGHSETILSPSINQDDTCGNGWVCEHRWRQIYQMVGFRNAVKGTNVTNWWDNGNNQVAFSRGGKGFVVFNLENYDLVQSLQTGLPAGKYCDVITGKRKGDSCTGRTVTVDNDGRAHVNVPANVEDMHLAIHVGKQSSLQTPETTKYLSKSDTNRQDQTNDTPYRSDTYCSPCRPSEKLFGSTDGSASELLLTEKIIPGENECPCSAIGSTSFITCLPNSSNRQNTYAKKSSCDSSNYSEGCKTSSVLRGSIDELQDGSDYGSLSDGTHGSRRNKSPNRGLQSQGSRSSRSNGNDGSLKKNTTDESQDQWSDYGSLSDGSLGSNKLSGNTRANNSPTRGSQDRKQPKSGNNVGTYDPNERYDPSYATKGSSDNRSPSYGNISPNTGSQSQKRLSGSGDDFGTPTDPKKGSYGNNEPSYGSYGSQESSPSDESNDQNRQSGNERLNRGPQSQIPRSNSGSNSMPSSEQESSGEKSINGDSQGSNGLPSSKQPNDSNDNAKYFKSKRPDTSQKSQDDTITIQSDKLLDEPDNGSSADDSKSGLLNGSPDTTQSRPNKEPLINEDNRESFDHKIENDPEEIPQNLESLDTDTVSENSHKRKGLRYYLNKIKKVILQRP